MTTSADFKKHAETGCCPKLNPEKYDEKSFEFKDKLFVKGHVITIFRIPINFRSVIKKLMKKIDSAHALDKDFLMLAEEKSLWKLDILIAVKKEVSGAVMTELNGTFITKVFEGPYKDMRDWIRNMHGFARSNGHTIKKMYFYYSTCPKCAKHYGKNYVVIFAQV